MFGTNPEEVRDSLDENAKIHDLLAVAVRALTIRVELLERLVINMYERRDAQQLFRRVDATHWEKNSQSSSLDIDPERDLYF